MMRLNKYIASSGEYSRRKADELIEAGRVTVNGAKPVLGQKIDPENDHVKVDGTLVTPAEQHFYLLLNKPPGFLSTRHDPEGRATVLDLVKPYDKFNLYPVGRLDYTTEGLVIMTNDGEFAARVGHPSTGPSKTYNVRVRGVPDVKSLDALRKGVRIENYVTAPAIVKLIRSRNNSWVEITLKEGKNRQIRKMFDAIGHPVVKLRRVRIGFLSSDSLKPGEYRLLRENEVARLMEKHKKPDTSAKPQRKRKK